MVSSGLCLSTGTGSTSWTFNINKLTQQAVEALLRIVFETTHFPINWKDKRLVEVRDKEIHDYALFYVFLIFLGSDPKVQQRDRV